MIRRDQLHRDGCALLRGAIPADWLARLRSAFDAGAKPSHEWPVPHQVSSRHASLDLDPTVQAGCRLPAVLSVVGELIGEQFFLYQVERREPVFGGGHQGLHRDLSAHLPGDSINAPAFFEGCGPENGAPSIVRGSHRVAPRTPSFYISDEPRAEQLCGSAGDILVFDADPLRAGCVKPSGVRRRSLLICCFALMLCASHLETAEQRSVQMDTTDRFTPGTDY